MPLLDFNSAETWNSLYTVYVDNQECHFERTAKDRIIGVDADSLIEAMLAHQLQTTDKILFIGSAFGWMAERFVELGYTNVTNCDNSTWIQQNKTENAVLPIHDIDITTTEGLEWAQTKAPFDWVISEDVLPILSDTEVLNLINSMRVLGRNVLHWMTVKMENCDQDSRLNLKTVDEWKTFLSPDYIVQRGRNQTA